MPDTRNIKVINLSGLLLGNVFVPCGKTASVDRVRAESLILDLHAIASTADEVDFSDLYPALTEEQQAAQAAVALADANKPASELIDWPGYQQLNKGALHTVDAVRAFVSDHPNNWIELLVLTEEDAAAIDARLNESPTTETTKKTKKPKGS